jgi:hypothetical protein
MYEEIQMNIQTCLIIHIDADRLVMLKWLCLGWVTLWVCTVVVKET